MLISKISVDPNFMFTVMHDYVMFHCSTDCCGELSLIDDTYIKIALISH